MQSFDAVITFSPEKLADLQFHEHVGFVIQDCFGQKLLKKKEWSFLALYAQLVIYKNDTLKDITVSKVMDVLLQDQPAALQTFQEWYEEECFRRYPTVEIKKNKAKVIQV